VRALDVTSAKRSPATPDLPTVAEAGYANFNATAWWGLVAPARVPAAVIQKLHADVAGNLRQPEMRERLGRDGVDVAGSTPQQFSEFIRAEIQRGVSR